MPSNMGPDVQLEKSRKGVIAGVVALVLVVAAFGGFMLLGGADFIAGLLAGETAGEVEIVEEVPAESTTPTAAPIPEPAAPMPSPEQLELMYFEQLASQEQIQRLVAGDIERFTLGPVTETPQRADVKVTAAYRDGTSLGGTISLIKYEGAWLFERITRDGNPPTTPRPGTADGALMRTVVEQQFSNQEIPAALVAGSYTTCAIQRVIAGSGTTEIEIELSGGNATPLIGRILLVAKATDTEPNWFITSFQKR